VHMHHVMAGMLHRAVAARLYRLDSRPRPVDVSSARPSVSSFRFFSIPRIANMP
jgi:hypothetical protein